MNLKCAIYINSLLPSFNVGRIILHKKKKKQQQYKQKQQSTTKHKGKHKLKSQRLEHIKYYNWIKESSDVLLL